MCEKKEKGEDNNNKANLYLQGTGSNILGRPISSENVTIVPVGPMTHLTVFDASDTVLAALSCMT